MRIYILLISFLSLTSSLLAQVKVFTSNATAQWQSDTIEWTALKNSADIIVNTEQAFQTIEGWGACFNERAWKALQYLPKKEQNKIMNLLFNEEACNFSYCRMPIGASDYALDYYSLNDNKGDYAMEKFSIERDRKYMLPYIKSAIKIKPKLQIWGSPWTPPAWMKTNNRYNRGSIKMDAKTLSAYALYFQKYVEAYRNEGVNIVAIHPQNEPLHLPAFPSCGWSGEQLNIFIRDYLGPHFAKHLPDCEIWLGTINGNDKTNEFEEYIQTVFDDTETAKFIVGAGFQWDGDAAVEQTIANYPNKKIMQTETKCGWGANDWKYAFETYKQMVWYLERNASYYQQWNMVLNETGMSSWGWKQNCMISVDTYHKSYKINPQYWVVRHFTQFVEPGASRIACSTNNEIQALAFKNKNGKLVVVCSNQKDKSQRVSLTKDDKSLDFKIDKESICTIIF